MDGSADGIFQAALTACGSSEKTVRSVLPRDAFLRESTI